MDTKLGQRPTLYLDMELHPDPQQPDLLLDLDPELENTLASHSDVSTYVSASGSRSLLPIYGYEYGWIRRLLIWNI